MQRMNANYTVTSRNAIQILKSTSTISIDFPEKFNVLFVIINLSANRQMQLQQIQISNINMILVVNWAWLICGNSMEVWLVWIFLSISFICCFCCTWNTNISINSLFGFVCVFHINRSMFGKRRIHDINHGKSKNIFEWYNIYELINCIEIQDVFFFRITARVSIVLIKSIRITFNPNHSVMFIKSPLKSVTLQTKFGRFTHALNVCLCCCSP